MLATKKLQRYAGTLSTIIGYNAKVLKQVPKRELAQWLSQQMESLGPTYIKIGQFMSSRKDIFGDEYVEAFACLRDKVKPMELAEVKQVFDENIDMTKFKYINTTPIASASIGQVHVAELASGKKVIVKIKRPYVGQMIREDTQFLLSVLSLLQYFNLENIEDSIELINDFEKNIMKEVDFSTEVQNLKKFRKMYHDNAAVIVPKVYTKLSSDNVIVMEYIESNDIASFSGDRRELAKKLMDFFISQLITNGYVHGDPHSGNIGVTARGGLVLYDFGNVINITTLERQRMKELIYFLLIRNKKGVITSLQKLGIKVLDKDLMYKYIDLYIEYLQTIDISKLSQSHGPTIKLPLKFTDKIFRLVRVYGILEGTCKDLDNKFNYFDLLSNYIGDVFLDEEFLKFKMIADTSQILNDWIEPMNDEPHEKASKNVTNKAKEEEHLVDKKHTPVMIDSRIVSVLAGVNLVLLLGNVFEIFYK